MAEPKPDSDPINPPPPPPLPGHPPDPPPIPATDAPKGDDGPRKDWTDSTEGDGAGGAKL